MSQKSCDQYAELYKEFIVGVGIILMRGLDLLILDGHLFENKEVLDPQVVPFMLFIVLLTMQFVCRSVTCISSISCLTLSRYMITSEGIINCGLQTKGTQITGFRRVSAGKA